MILLVVRHGLVLRLGEVGGVLGLSGCILLCRGGFLGVALRRRRRQLRLRGEDQPHRESRGDRGDDLAHEPSFMCGAPAGTAPPAAARLPDFTSLYQISWCSFAQASSTTPSRIARHEPSPPSVPMPM